MSDKANDLSSQAGRLQWAMRRKNLRPVDLWRPLGMDSGAMSRTMSGTRKIQPHEAPGMANILGVKLEWLTFGRGDPLPSGEESAAPAPPSNIQPSFAHVDGQGVWVPLISWVAAGAMGDVVDRSEFDDVRQIYAPDLDAAGEWIALRVDGTSMDKVSPPDSIIFVNLRQRALIQNACYVIMDEQGKTSYKRYRDGDWEPASYHEQPPLDLDGAITVIGRVRRSMIDM